MTVDVVLFQPVPEERRLDVLLIQRGQDPFGGQWALPGGFVDMDEAVDTCARREVREETGLECGELYPLGVFDEPERDPRGRTISVAHWGLAPPDNPEPRGADDARAAGWVPLEEAEGLAFDHDRILVSAKAALRDEVLHRPFVLDWMTRPFTLRELQRVIEAILDQPIDGQRLGERLLAERLIVPVRMEASPVPEEHFKIERERAPWPARERMDLSDIV